MNDIILNRRIVNNGYALYNQMVPTDHLSVC